MGGCRRIPAYLDELCSAISQRAWSLVDSGERCDLSGVRFSQAPQ